MEIKMKNIITKIKHYIARPKGFKRLDIVERATIQSLNQNSLLNNHIIALARLQFVKPEVLYREANNTKANAEYLQQLLKVKKETEEDIK